MKITEIILDLDGVLSNFMRTAMARNGVFCSLENYPKEAGWDIVCALNILRARIGLKPVSTSTFWGSLNSREMWAGLPLYFGAKDFLKALEDMVGQKNICICTSDTLSPLCTAGKVQWININLPQYTGQRLIGPEKWRLAHPGVCLIDDSDQNCAAFKARGGQALLVPRPWNTNSQFTSDAYNYTLRHLRAL